MASFWNSHTISNHQTLPLGADIFQAPDTSTEIWYIASKLLISSQKELLHMSSTNNPLVKKRASIRIPPFLNTCSWDKESLYTTHDNNEENSLKPKINGTKPYSPQSSFIYHYYFLYVVSHVYSLSSCWVTEYVSPMGLCAPNPDVLIARLILH